MISILFQSLSKISKKKKEKVENFTLNFYILDNFTYNIILCKMMQIIYIFLLY